MSTCILMHLCHSLGCKLTSDITAMLQMSPWSRECALVGTSAWALRRTPQRGRQRKSSMVLYSVTQMPETRSDGVFSKVASVRVWLQRPFKHAGEALITIIRLMRWKTWILNEQSGFVCCHQLWFLHSRTVICFKCFYNGKTLEGFHRGHVS